MAETGELMLKEGTAVRLIEENVNSRYQKLRKIGDIGIIERYEENSQMYTINNQSYHYTRVEEAILTKLEKLFYGIE